MLMQDTSTTLGPAEVIGAGDDLVRVRMNGADLWAQPALAFSYRPRPGDTVLVIAQGGQCYLIGTLRPTGRTVVEFAGDVELRATGTLTVTGGTGVAVAAPEVEVRADKVEMVTRTLINKAICSYQWVRELLSVRAGRSRTVVDGTLYLSAEQSYLRCDKEMKIDGETIHLG